MANLLKPTGVNNIWAITGTKTDPGLTKASTGWVVELPPYQTANWIEFRQDSFIAHSNQHGIPEWDAVTEYQGNVSYTKGSNGIVYKAISTNTNTDPANPLNSAIWTQAFETYGSVAVVTASLNAHLANYNVLAGIGNTTTARTNLSVYSKAESDARFAALGGLNTQTFNVATATLSTHAVPLGQFTSLLTQATEAQAGIAQIATNTEVAAGTNDTDMVTPLKAATLYLSKAGNLAGLGNTATARTNLGLGPIATMSDTTFLKVANNLSDVPNKATARANLGLSDSGIYPSNTWLIRSNNLSDLVDVAAARTNLGLTSTATTPIGNVMLKADSLAGIGNQAAARSNLGLSDSVLYPSNTWLIRGLNLGDLANVQAARNNLGLSDMAVIPSGNVMFKYDNLAGIGNPAAARANLGLSDSGVYPSNTWLVAVNNLADVPNKASARNNLGLQGLATANAFGILGTDITFTNNWDAAGGATILPNFMKIQWGTVVAGQTITFRYPFTISYAVTLTHGPSALGAPGAGITGKTNSGFTLGYGTGGYMWIAIGV